MVNLVLFTVIVQRNLREKKPKKTYRPPNDHPWKLDMFKRYVKNVSHASY